MTYFRTGIRTIIGAKLFHGPVRDGKGWYQLAMVIRRNLSRAVGCCYVGGDSAAKIIEVESRRIGDCVFWRAYERRCDKYEQWVLTYECMHWNFALVSQSYRVKPHEQLVLVS